jgi:enoyl-CoA hydratase
MKTAATRLAPRLLRASPFSTAAPEVIFNPAAAPGVALITFNRPSALNALSSSVARQVVSAAKSADADAGVRAVVLAGSGSKAFAAGADVKELAGYDHDKVRGIEKGKREGENACFEVAMRSMGTACKTRPNAFSPTPTPTLPTTQARSTRLLADWDALSTIRLPMIAAVEGLALGGGCEAALMCDLIVASESASFGQPEVTLGVTPGMGATQRLTKALGKYRAMDLLLTGRWLTAAEAQAAGLVARVAPPGQAVAAALELATSIAAGPPDATAAIKRCVNAALETHLASGMEVEHAEFWGCFGGAEQREGMAAFLDKRAAVWPHAHKK